MKMKKWLYSEEESILKSNHNLLMASIKKLTYIAQWQWRNEALSSSKLT